MGRHCSTMAIGVSIKACFSVLAVGAVFLAIEGAEAQSLKELRAQDAEEQALAREVAYTDTQCGGKISSSIDWRSAADWPDNVSLVSSCDGALGALEAYCRNNNGKRRVTRFVCAGDGAGASLRGGTLRYGASPGDNGFASTKAVLDGAN